MRGFRKPQTLVVTREGQQKGPSVEQGLLAHLSFRLSYQHEVIATEGLAYILKQSDCCRRSMEHLAKSAGCDLPEIVYYDAEVAGEGLERPDILGRTDQGTEAIIIEGKFQAGLTDNQPNSYLHRLPNNSSGLLLFVVPQLRVASLWREIVSRAGEKAELGPEAELPDGSKCIDVNRTHKLLMVSWSNLLNALLHPAQRSSDAISGDILQLLGFCNRIEGAAFTPFNSEELTSDHLARRNRDLCDLVDAITEKLVDDGIASTKGMKATPRRSGYIRYIYLVEDDAAVGASIRLDYSAWAGHSASPLWVETQSDGTKVLRSVFKQLAAEDRIDIVDKGRTIAIPLCVKPGQDFSDIVTCAVQRVIKIVRLWSSRNAV